MMFLTWLGARLSEPITWIGIAHFAAATGAAFVAAGFLQTGLIVGAVGAGFGGVGAFITKERGNA
jgi:hypothetical protein